jgi:hypothetical protein
MDSKVEGFQPANTVVLRALNNTLAPLSFVIRLKALPTEARLKALTEMADKLVSSALLLQSSISLNSKY